MSKREIGGIGSGSIVRRKTDGSYETVTDDVAIEEPLEIRIDQKSVAVTMRTPGHDEELAAGFLLSEGIIRARKDLRKIEPGVSASPSQNVASVLLSPGVDLDLTSAQRFGTISSSCGLCGKTSIDFIQQQLSSLASDSRGPWLDVARLLQMPDQLRKEQRNFGQTGGIHAAGLYCEDGTLLILREDVGRHNAVDKVIGRAFLDGLVPLSRHVLLVSGRASLEIVQKGLAAGVPVVAAVSAPTSLAINFARAAGQTLIGFLRPPTFNVYAHVERLRLSK